MFENHKSKNDSTIAKSQSRKNKSVDKSETIKIDINENQISDGVEEMTFYRNSVKSSIEIKNDNDNNFIK